MKKRSVGVGEFEENGWEERLREQGEIFFSWKQELCVSYTSCLLARQENTLYAEGEGSHADGPRSHWPSYQNRRQVPTSPSCPSYPSRQTASLRSNHF